MVEVTKEQIRRFRLHTHHLDRWYGREDALRAAGACGFQNSPPGAWETALHNRVPHLTREEMRQLLEEDKLLLQGWSYRGAPVVFPVAESHVFLGGLVPQGEEPWIYTGGIGLALDFLRMNFQELLGLLRTVLTGLDGETVKSKGALDQLLAGWMLPYLPPDKRQLWNSPSMYGSPDKQTVGGAVVSFLLRPCGYMGLVVFGRREGISPTFTSYKSWLGRSLEPGENCGEKLARKYLHSFGPATPAGFERWLGASRAQAQRLWGSLAHRIEPVTAGGRKGYILSEDRELLLSPPRPERSLHMLGGHDPYLGLEDRAVILEDRALQRQVWQTVSNPGVLLLHGEIKGVWRPRKKGKALELEITMWGGPEPGKREVEELAWDYCRFQGLELNRITFI